MEKGGKRVHRPDTGDLYKVRHNNLMYIRYANTYKYTLRAKRLKFTFHDNFNRPK